MHQTGLSLNGENFQTDIWHPTSTKICMWGKQPAAMLAAKSLAGEPQETYITYVSHKAHSGFETQRIHHQKSKTRVSVAPKNGHLSNKNFKKRENYQTGSFTDESLDITTSISNIISIINLSIVASPRLIYVTL